MNISLLISGNLTGFGRFFTSPAAKELLGTDKIDLDNHNHISFLGDNEKAYSITFAQRYIAISLYTRILDSFRRPGELVVTLLIPRNQIIVPNSGPSIGAVYSLLNKVCDKFFEKNFQDGMINQNPVVLGQDYYSEILDNYRLKPMSMREVNPTPSSVKKVGYVKAQETDIPKYLDTPCRESYNDHNLIIIAQSAPVGIDEEPEEVILYSIHIKNNGATLPGRVKLTSPIYKYQAQAGEKPFPIQGSYKDAVEHLLEPRITARMMPNDVVEISYNFEKEEKTVNFIFLDKNTGAPISFDVVQPSVVIDGIKLPISSKTFTFRGAEIHASKKLVSDNSNYTISKRSEFIDLSRIGNNQDLTVYVEQGFMLAETFPKPHDYKKTFVFINKSNGQRETFYVTDRANIHLSGTISDWDFMMDSENFSVPQQAVRIVNGHWYIQVNEKPKVKTTRTTTKVTNSSQTVVVQKVSGDNGNVGVSLSEGTSMISSSKTTNKKTNFLKVVLLVLPILLVSCLTLWHFWNPLFGDNNESEPEGNGGTQNLSYGACVCYYDDSKKNDIDTLLLNQIDDFKFYFFDKDNHDITNNISKTDSCFGHNQKFLHVLNVESSIGQQIKVQIKFIYNNEECLIAEDIINVSEYNKDSITSMEYQAINYGIRKSQWQEFKDLYNKSFSSLKSWNDWYNKFLMGTPEELLSKVKIVWDEKKPEERAGTGTGTANSGNVAYPDNLNTNSSLTQKQLLEGYMKSKNPEIKQRAKYMHNALKCINNLQRVSDKSKLSEAQRETVNLYHKGLADSDFKKILEDAKGRNELQSFGQVYRVVLNFK